MEDLLNFDSHVSFQRRGRYTLTFPPFVFPRAASTQYSLQAAHLLSDPHMRPGVATHLRHWTPALEDINL